MSDEIFPGLNRTLLDAALSITSHWDFTLAKTKLLEPNYAAWSKVRTDAAERGYKRYLSLIKALGGYRPVPNADIDRFWHEHILDTERYEKDCSELFGEFLHHYPYFGMRGEQDDTNWKAAAAFSSSIWKTAFGEDLYKKYDEKGPVAALQSRTTRLFIPGEYFSGEANNDMGIEINITINIYGGKAEQENLPVPEVIKPDDASARDSDIMKCPQKCPDRPQP
jgi:hypothetical protein